MDPCAPDAGPGRQVVFLLPGRPRRPVGGYKVVYAYANDLARRGNAVHVVHSPGFLDGEGSRPHPLARGKFATSLLLSRVSRITGTQWADLDSTITVMERLTPPQLSVGPGDLVIATAVQTMPYAARVAAATGARGVALIQGFETWSASTEVVEAAWRLPLFRIVVSPWLAERGRDLGVETHLLRNAVRADDFPLGAPIEKRPFRVGSMLSRQPSKRMDVAVAVFRRLRDLAPHIQGVAFGVKRRPRELPRYVEYVRSPSPDELARLYQGLRVYVSTSDTEGWGLPASEATMAGAAVVSTENGGTRSALGDSALYARPGDVDGLVRQVLMLVGDEDAAQLNATRGRARLAAYSFEDATDRLSRLLDEANA